MEDLILREPEVKRLTGLSRTTRWRLERKGGFPQRRQLSENAVGWLGSEISQWIESRTGRRREVLPGAGRPEVQPRQAGRREDRPDEGHHNLARRLTRRQKTQSIKNLNHEGR
jgi:prophage regulatory protein